MDNQDDLTRLTYRPVDAARWPDMERLFESRGAPGYCWCMAWRQTPEETKHTDHASRKSFMHARVAAGVPVGILAYLDSEPVAWCSVAPRSTYRRLVSDGSPDAGVWSIVCFFALRRLRGRGIVRRLLRAAVDHARSEGALVIEAYPVDPGSPSYRHMGFTTVFREAGFVEVGREGTRRHIMRLGLAP